MEDWRTKPRVGRQAFMSHLDEITERLGKGETQKNIYGNLVDRGLELSYQQFNSYVRRLIIGSSKKSHHRKTQEETKPINLEKNDSKPIVRNPADLLKLRRKPIDLEELRNSQGNGDENSNS